MGMTKVFTGDKIGTLVPHFKNSEDEDDVEEWYKEKLFLVEHISNDVWYKHIREYQEVCEWKTEDGHLDERTHTTECGFFLEFEDVKLKVEKVYPNEQGALDMNKAELKFLPLVSEFDRVGDDKDRIYIKYPHPVRTNTIEGLYFFKEVYDHSYLGKEFFIECDDDDYCENGKLTDKAFLSLRKFYYKTIERQKKFIDDFVNIQTVMFSNIYQDETKLADFVDIQTYSQYGSFYDHLRDACVYRFELKDYKKNGGLIMILWIDTTKTGEIFYNIDIIEKETANKPSYYFDGNAQIELEVKPAICFHHLKQGLYEYSFIDKALINIIR